MKGMRLILVFVFIALSSVLSAQQIEERNVGSFNEIRVSQGITVYLKRGNEEKVRVEARGIDLRDVLTETFGSRLKISLDDGRHNNISVKVYVTYKSLEEIAASSASGVFSEDIIRGDKMEISVSSAADVEIEVEVNEVEASVSSSGDLEIKGKTKSLRVEASSAGGIDAYDLDTETAYVRASSAGSVKVSASNEINARASSGASIRYKGNPSRSQTDSSSGGSVRKSN